MLPEPPLAESVLMLDSVPEAPELPASPPPELFLDSQAPNSAVPSTSVAKNAGDFLVNIVMKGWFG